MINKFNLKKSLPAGRQGFTLIETLAAVLLLSIALVGPMTIAQKGLQTALISKDQNTAFNLAQDAVEFVRFARDTNCLAAAAATPGACPALRWLNGDGSGNTVNLLGCISTDGSAACTIDSYANSVSACVGGYPCTTALNYDNINNNFTYNSIGTGVTGTIFTRSVQIQYNPLCTTLCNPAEAAITVTVSWSDPVAHSVAVKESIFNWQ